MHTRNQGKYQEETNISPGGDYEVSQGVGDYYTGLCPRQPAYSWAEELETERRAESRISAEARREAVPVSSSLDFVLLG